MSFVLGSLFYAFLGSVIGLVAHFINGVVQSHIRFDWKYVKGLLTNFVKITVVWVIAIIIVAGVVQSLPESFYMKFGTDKDFMHHLIYYLYAFAAFDFTLDHVIEKKRSTKDVL